jgi:hypothetical protein
LLLSLCSYSFDTHLHFVFLKAQSHPPVGILEDVVAEREIELGGQTTTTTTGMKLG